MGARNFREYQVWKEAIAFATYVYKVTSNMPWFEKKGLGDQLQRAVVSISSNIAEGNARTSDVEFAHFLDISLGSAFEVESQLLLALNVGFMDEKTYNGLLDKINSIERQIAALTATIRNKRNNTK